MGNRVIPANDQIHADAVPDPSDQEVAELSVNAVTGNLYVKRVDGSIHSLQDKFNEFAERVETEIGNIEHSIDCVRMGADGEVGLVSRHGVVLIESGAYRDRNKDIHKGTVVFQSLSYDSNTGNPNPCRVESYGYGGAAACFQSYVENGGYVKMQAEEDKTSVSFCATNGMEVSGSEYDSGASTPSLKNATAFKVTVDIDTAASGRPLNANTEFTGTVNVSGSESTPASATAAGTKGDVRFDSGYIYICVADNTWKRASLATF